MARDIVLVLEGGCMLGVFGVGVLTAFERENLYDRVHSIYGVSAGAQNAAHFLARNSEAASRFYCEYCAENRVLDFSKKRRYFLDLLTGSRRTNLLDFRHVRKATREIQSRIDARDIPFYVQVIDVKTGDVKFADGLDARMLLASSSAAPLYPRPVRVGRRQYVDGLRFSKEALARIAAEHKDKTIIYVLNDAPTHERRSFFYDWMHSLLLFLAFNTNVARANLRMTGPTREELKRYKNVRVVANKKEIDKFCTERRQLHQLYLHGIRSGRTVLHRLGITRSSPGAASP